VSFLLLYLRLHLVTPKQPFPLPPLHGFRGPRSDHIEYPLSCCWRALFAFLPAKLRPPPPNQTRAAHRAHRLTPAVPRVFPWSITRIAGFGHLIAGKKKKIRAPPRVHPLDRNLSATTTRGWARVLPLESHGNPRGSPTCCSPATFRFPARSRFPLWWGGCTSPSRPCWRCARLLSTARAAFFFSRRNADAHIVLPFHLQFHARRDRSGCIRPLSARIPLRHTRGGFSGRIGFASSRWRGKTGEVARAAKRARRCLASSVSASGILRRESISLTIRANHPLARSRSGRSAVRRAGLTCFGAKFLRPTRWFASTNGYYWSINPPAHAIRLPIVTARAVRHLQSSLNDDRLPTLAGAPRRAASTTHRPDDLRAFNIQRKKSYGSSRILQRGTFGLPFPKSANTTRCRISSSRPTYILWRKTPVAPSRADWMLRSSH